MKKRRLDLSQSSAEIVERINDDGKIYMAIQIKDNPQDERPFLLGIKRARLIKMHWNRIMYFIETCDRRKNRAYHRRTKKIQ